MRAKETKMKTTGGDTKESTEVKSRSDEPFKERIAEEIKARFPNTASREKDVNERRPKSGKGV